MRIKTVNSPNTCGSVLVVTLVIAAILSITLGSYLALVSNQSRSVTRSQNWNQALVIAEAGVEDAFQLLNKFSGTPALTNWVSTSTVDNWSRPGNGNVYHVERFMDDEKMTRYVVYVTNMDTTLNNRAMIHATGYITLPSAFGTNVTLERTVVVDASIYRLFNVAMAALGAIDLKGNNVSSDSFDSGDPDHSTNGLYNIPGATTPPPWRKAGGDVATNNTLTNSNFTVGNANIAGKIITGPYGTYSIGPNGVVGSVPWVENPANKGKIETGWAQNDMNVIFKDVVLPDSLLSPLPVGLPGLGTGGPGVAVVNGVLTPFDHVFTSPLIKNYVVTDNGTIYVGTNTQVKLKITVGTFNPDKIYVAGTGTAAGKMEAYLTGTAAVLGTEHKTESGKAENLSFYGLPSVTKLDYKGNGNFTGVIYAPQADFHLAGGGKDEWDFIGSSVTALIQMNGKYHFHYDEDLRKNGPNIGYRATSWKEF